MLAVDVTGVRVAHRKSWPADAERRRFTPGGGPTVLEVDGWQVGVGICRDTEVVQHIVETAASGVDVYVAGVAHRPEELAEQQARGVVIARTCGAYVVLAAFAGPTGDVFTATCGTSTIWAPDGTVLGRAGAGADDRVRAVLA